MINADIGGDPADKIVDYGGNCASPA